MTSTMQPQPWAHRPGPRSRPDPAADPERVRAGRSARRRGSENEKRTMARLILPFHPRARQTRPGERGPDTYTEGVGDRTLEFTVARWADIMMKLDQAAYNARAAGTAEYAVIKPAQVQPGQRRRWFAILDGEVYMRLTVEMDILRAFRRAITENAGRDKQIIAERLAAMALEKLAGVSLDAE